MIALLVAIAIAAGFLFVATFVLVTDGSEVVVERLGKFSRVLRPGLHLLLPFVDKVRHVRWTCVEDVGDGSGNVKSTIFDDYRIPTCELMFDPPEAEATTLDRVPVTSDVVVHYVIVDTKKAVYGVRNLYAALESHVETAARAALAHMSLDDAVGGASEIEIAVRKDLSASEKEWGLSLRKVRIQRIEPSKDIAKATEEGVRAEREAKARGIQGRAEAETRIAAAEADRRVAVIEWETETLRVQGEADREHIKAEIRKRAAVLAGEAEGEAIALRAAGEATRIAKVLEAGATPEYLARALDAAAFQSFAENPHRGDMVVPIDYARFLGTAPAKIVKGV